MDITDKTTAEDIQKFIRKHRLMEAYEASGFLFRVKEHAERHDKLKGGKGVTVHAKAETEDAKAKPKKAKTEETAEQ